MNQFWAIMTGAFLGASAMIMIMWLVAAAYKAGQKKGRG